MAASLDDIENRACCVERTLEHVARPDAQVATQHGRRRQRIIGAHHRRQVERDNTGRPVGCESKGAFLDEGVGRHLCSLGMEGVDMRSEEHTSELQSLMRISYAVFCLKKKRRTNTKIQT